MRIISGVHKGRKIIAPKKLPVRPTTDRAKESLFNILRNSYALGNIEVLDLFAGTGNISYEFASRGAIKVTAVDEHFKCIQFIDKTAEMLEMPIKTTKLDVYLYLSNIKETYDVIYADPPYNFSVELFEKIANLVFEKNLLHKDGTLVIEHSSHTNLSHVPHFVELRNYGSSSFSFFS